MSRKGWMTALPGQADVCTLCKRKPSEEFRRWAREAIEQWWPWAVNHPTGSFERAKQELQKLSRRHGRQSVQLNAAGDHDRARFYEADAQEMLAKLKRVDQQPN